MTKPFPLKTHLRFDPWLRRASMGVALLLALPDAARANLPTTIPVNDQSFDVMSMTDQQSAMMKAITAWASTLKVPGHPTAEENAQRKKVLAALPVSDAELKLEYDQSLEGKSPAERKAYLEALEDFQKRAGAILKKHFEDVARRHGAVITDRNGYREIRIDDGIGFYLDFLDSPDPEKRIVARAFLKSFNRKGEDGPAADLFSALTDLSPTTRVLGSSRLSDEEWEKLAHFLQKTSNDRFARRGNYMVIGNGLPFFETVHLVDKAARLEDPSLTRSFGRVERFLADKGLPIGQGNFQGAAAYFDPNSFKFFYVMPGRADLNTFTHETTHARFFQFTSQVTSWLESRGLAVPYEIDGTGTALQGLGGFYTLLNEMNSFRTGDAFDGMLDDAAILKVLTTLYGAEAGQDAIDHFASYWPVDKIRGISVPRLILRAVRALNHLDGTGMAELGKQGLREQDLAKQMNFLRLYSVRYKNQAPPAEIAQLHQALASQSKFENIRELAGAPASPTGKPMPPEELARMDGEMAKWRNLKSAAIGWIRGIAKDNAIVMPLELTDVDQVLLKLASDDHLSDYDQVIAKARQLNYPLSFMNLEGTKEVFSKVLASPGASVGEKLTQYLVRWNQQGFGALWADFQRSPSADLANLLSENHWAEFKGPELQKLFAMALDKSYATQFMSPTVGLLQAVLEKKGMSTIYAPRALESLKAAQAALNEINHLPPDSYMPKDRSPDQKVADFGPDLDEYLSKALFDGKPGAYRVAVINTLRNQAFPSDFPKVFQRVVQILTDPKSDNNDLWLARYFLVPQGGGILYPTAEPWGREIAKQVMKSPTPTLTAQEEIAEFYRLCLVNLLPELGRDGMPQAHLDGAARERLLKAIAGMSPSQKQEFDTAIDHLWTLLGSKSPGVSSAAAYAMAGEPLYLLGLEDRLAGGLVSDSPVLRQRGIQLLGMVEPGFVPKFDEAASRLALDASESRWLRLRIPASERKPWCNTAEPFIEALKR